MIYYITYFLTKVLSWVCFPFTAYHTDKIPRQGAFILASNHVSNLDPVLLGISSVRRLDFMAKIELFKGALGFFLIRLGAYPIRRGQGDLGAMRETLKRLKDGRVVLIFVEGTRQLSKDTSKAQAGVGFLAVKSGVPIVPVYVQGTNNVMAPGSKCLKRGRVFATYGEPFYLKSTQDYEAASQLILEKIYALEK